MKQGTLSNFNLQTIQTHLKSWMGGLKEYIRQTDLLQPADVKSLPRGTASQVALVGPGPSLSENLAELHDFPGKIITCPTAWPFLRYHGIRPDILVIGDPSPRQRDILEDSGLFDEIPLPDIVCPVLANENLMTLLFEAASHRTYFYKPYIQTQDGSIHNLFNAMLQELARPVSTYFAQAGSVSSTMLVVAYNLHEAIPFEKVWTLGIDFAYRLDHENDEVIRRVPFAKAGTNGTMTLTDTGHSYSHKLSWRWWDDQPTDNLQLRYAFDFLRLALSSELPLRNLSPEPRIFSSPETMETTIKELHATLFPQGASHE